MTLQAQLQQAVNEWTASKGAEDKEQAVHAILDTPEYRALPYLQRNRPFVTSSKLKEFRECAFHAKMRYIDEIDPGQDQEDYFVIGSAVDRRLTDGEEAYQQQYVVVPRRTDKVAEENPGKVLLTGTQSATIDQAVKEYRSREFFPQTPQKRNVLFLLHGLPCKAELDAFDPVSHTIGDIKTTSSITTFEPEMYTLQMAFYAFGIEKRFGEKVSAELFVIDKHSGWSRSHKWVFSQPTLQSHFFEVEELARQWKECSEVNIWPHVDPRTEHGLRTCWNSPYWPICPFCRAGSPTIL